MTSGARMISQQVGGKVSGDQLGTVGALSDVIVKDPLVSTRTQIPMLSNRPVLTSNTRVACQPRTQPLSVAARIQLPG